MWDWGQLARVSLCSLLSPGRQHDGSGTEAMNKHHAVASRGARPLATGERAPGPYGRAVIGLFAVGLAAALGCSSKADQKAYDPVSLGMLPSDAPLYDDNETTIFQVSRPISLPIVSPNDIDRQRLAAAMPAPYDHIQ